MHSGQPKVAPPSQLVGQLGRFEADAIVLDGDAESILGEVQFNSRMFRL